MTAPMYLLPQSEESTLLLVPRDRVLSIIHQVVPLLEPALARASGRYEIGDIIALCLAEQMQLWVSVYRGTVEAVCVTQINIFPRKKVLGIVFVGGGERDHWMPFGEKIIAWGKEKGCTQVDAYDARHGAWGRITGWKERYRVIGTEI